MMTELRNGQKEVKTYQNICPHTDKNKCRCPFTLNYLKDGQIMRKVNREEIKLISLSMLPDQRADDLRKIYNKIIEDNTKMVSFSNIMKRMEDIHNILIIDCSHLFYQNNTKLYELSDEVRTFIYNNS